METKGKENLPQSDGEGRVNERGENIRVEGILFAKHRALMREQDWTRNYKLLHIVGLQNVKREWVGIAKEGPAKSSVGHLIEYNLSIYWDYSNWKAKDLKWNRKVVINVHFWNSYKNM